MSKSLSNSIPPEKIALFTASTKDENFTIGSVASKYVEHATFGLILRVYKRSRQSGKS